MIEWIKDMNTKDKIRLVIFSILGAVIIFLYIQNAVLKSRVNKNIKSDVSDNHKKSMSLIRENKDRNNKTIYKIDSINKILMEYEKAIDNGDYSDAKLDSLLATYSKN